MEIVHCISILAIIIMKINNNENLINCFTLYWNQLIGKWQKKTFDRDEQGRKRAEQS